MPALEDDGGLTLGKSRFRVNITEPPRDGRTTRVHPHPEVPRVQVDGSVVLDDGEVGHLAAREVVVVAHLGRCRMPIVVEDHMAFESRRDQRAGGRGEQVGHAGPRLLGWKSETVDGVAPVGRAVVREYRP